MKGGELNGLIDAIARFDLFQKGDRKVLHLVWMKGDRSSLQKHSQPKWRSYSPKERSLEISKKH
ncbi:MAG: hypothetical protein EAZ09_13890 [Oscillatoriales cyanobacterium]|nr:MAG: hypothetical protein EAZ18_07030 [Oscillatoriales cyanobacterium]TAH20626.1 MAG: hypothetical protein EAZ09_13890 [Oscillatoriales cyanobacterium]